MCGNWRAAKLIIDKVRVQNSNKITSHIKGALLWGVVELCSHPRRQSGTVDSKMNSLKNNDFICFINFRFLNDIKENTVKF